MKRVSTGRGRRNGFLRPLLEFQAVCLLVFIPPPHPLLLRHDKMYQLNAAKRSKQFLLCKKEYLCSNSVF